MASIIIPGGCEYDRNTVFLQFMSKDPAKMQITFNRISNAIMRSIADDVKRDPLANVKSLQNKREVTRRFNICAEWIRRALGDLNFPFQKAVDLIYKALRSELDGRIFDPDTRTNLWSPS